MKQVEIKDKIPLKTSVNVAELRLYIQQQRVLMTKLRAKNIKLKTETRVLFTQLENEKHANRNTNTQAAIVTIEKEKNVLEKKQLEGVICSQQQEIEKLEQNIKNLTLDVQLPKMIFCSIVAGITLASVVLLGQMLLNNGENTNQSIHFNTQIIT